MKTIKDFDLENKKVIIRVDFNVPIENGVISDDNRIKESIETINYALNHKAKVILLSHLGRVKDESDKIKYTLKPVADRLSELLHKNVIFVPFTRGINVENAINEMQSGDVILLENTRFEDLNGKKESSNDDELGKYWASLGDIFINDAFGTSHREHASNAGITKYLPSGIGFLIEKEIKNIYDVINNPVRPWTLILGGAKVSDKIGLIDNLIDKCDYILIGGGMAYTFLKAKGQEVGSSLVDNDNIAYCQNLLKKTNKIILPIDNVCQTSNGDILVKEEMTKDDIGYDIGPKTIELFKKYINLSKTIIWNGPLGYFEKKPYDNGTRAICESIASKDKISIVGGGDTSSCVINMGYKDKFTHVSTGGGATISLLEGKEMPFVKYMRG